MDEKAKKSLKKLNKKQLRKFKKDLKKLNKILDD